MFEDLYIHIDPIFTIHNVYYKTQLAKMRVWLWRRCFTCDILVVGKYDQNVASPSNTLRPCSEADYWKQTRCQDL